MSNTSPATCPKCQSPVAPGFESCPQCGVIFAKIRNRPSGDLYSAPSAYGEISPSPGRVVPAVLAGTTKEIWKAFGIAAAAALLGFFCYQELDTMEQQGGSVRMNVLVILLYKIAGTTGVALAFGAVTLFFLVSGIRQLAAR